MNRMFWYFKIYLKLHDEANLTQIKKPKQYAWASLVVVYFIYNYKQSCKSQDLKNLFRLVWLGNLRHCKCMS